MALECCCYTGQCMKLYKVDFSRYLINSYTPNHVSVFQFLNYFVGTAVLHFSLTCLKKGRVGTLFRIYCYLACISMTKVGKSFYLLSWAYLPWFIVYENILDEFTVGNCGIKVNVIIALAWVNHLTF